MAVIGPPPESPFDPTDIICPWCGDICTKAQHSSGSLISIRIKRTSSDYYVHKGKAVSEMLQTWHYECRLEHDLQELEKRKNKGWLRRLVEWIW